MFARFTIDVFEKSQPTPSGAKSSGPTDNSVKAGLDALWKEARYRIYSPKNLWTWIDLNRRFEMRFVRPSSVKVKVPFGTLPDCPNCTDICCTGKNAVVSLRLHDIAQLMDAGLSDYISHEHKREVDKKDTWAAHELSWSIFAKSFPVLERDSTGTCALLTEELQCGAYPAWPLSCARYPYSLDVLNNEVFLAAGCRSHRQMTLEDPPKKMRDLVDAAVRAYNERIKDIVLLHVALPQLHALGLTEHLRLTGRLQKRVAKLSKSES